MFTFITNHLAFIKKLVFIEKSLEHFLLSLLVHKSYEFKDIEKEYDNKFSVIDLM